jgi:hypothetical protein
MSIKLNTASGGSITLQEADTASNLTLTVPAQAGSIVAADSSGNVGIGTSSPQAKLVSAGSSSTVFKAIILRNGDGTTGSSATIDFETSAGAQGDEASMAGRVAGVRTGAGTSGALAFSTTNSGTLSERMRIDSSGRVTMPYQPMFQARSAGSNSSGILVFSDESIDVGGNYNTSNGRFTAPVTGKYYFYTQLLMNSGASDIRFKVNGSAQNTNAETNETTLKQISLTQILSLSANDYVEVDVWAGSTYGGSYTSFSGFLIG